ncbi:MAG: hypothetical protein SV186_02365 [Candidatus Nanohaloarchaea archaeon]|nr:hypothetical protein [Candidatus Nanohaloarchaea archaeon]
MARAYDADALSSGAVDRLQEYGVEVDEAAAVGIHPDTAAPGGERSRGGYSPQLDFIQLYAPLFESDATVEEAFVHEYVHKYQVDARIGSPGPAFHAAVEELDELSEMYADMLADLDEDRADEVRELGVGGIVGDEGLLRRVALAINPARIDHLHGLAREEYETWDDLERRQEVAMYFEDAVVEEMQQRWGEVMEYIAPLSDRADAMDREDVDLGAEEEAYAYYAGIAVGGRIDDEAYIEAEKEEILDPDRNYDEPERQVELLEELIDRHRELREAGLTEEDAIAEILAETG